MEFCVKLLSLPLWERGLKYSLKFQSIPNHAVAPLVGAWIEICSSIIDYRGCRSLPLWERGLK